MAFSSTTMCRPGSRGLPFLIDFNKDINPPWQSIQEMPNDTGLPSRQFWGRNRGPESLSHQRVLNEQVAALYNDHHDAICRFARLLLGNREDAEEVAQEIYAKLLEGRVVLPSSVSRSWLL